jgi:hypothetical protein
MKTKLLDAGIIIVLVLSFSLASSAFAVEGGLGRPISGMQIAPFAGVIAPEPGLAVATGETYYEGSIGGGRTVPIAGLLVANVDMKAAFTPIALSTSGPRRPRSGTLLRRLVFRWPGLRSRPTFPLARFLSGKQKAPLDCSIWFLLRS